MFSLLPCHDEAPLGASLDKEGCNFSVCSPEATEVTLCLFDQDEQEIASFPLKERRGAIWMGYVKGVKAGQFYGYRVNGRNDPANGYCFDPTKLLIDPYAKQLSREQKWDYDKYRFDNASLIAKSVVVDSGDFDWKGVKKPGLRDTNAVVYETHVKGFTKNHPEVPEELRGTYLGMCEPCVIEHLKRIGVTAVQFLPLHAHMDESRLVELNLCNYWGYNTINFFSPEPKYAKDPANAVNEFKTMVRTFHENGISVIMDVVYNHTAEGGFGGPYISFRGFYNRTFYQYDKNAQGHKIYTNDTNCTGCGNSVNVDDSNALRLVIDSLRYWATEMQVDGFRFDLATTLAREEFANGYSSNAAFFKAVRLDPVISQCLLIAEPWDIGGYGYRVGQFPPDWHELNDRYRDTIRSFWKGDEGKMADFATRLLGSRDLYPKGYRPIQASVNFITYHDGFTLHDVVSYNGRHNEANCEGNRDGHNQNLSYNYGEEGPTANVRISHMRELQKRNMLTTLMLSQGIPHFVAGDEMGRTQMGNNNAYCQDNRISWMNWDLSQDDEDLISFVGKLVRLRLESTVFRNLHLRDDLYFGTAEMSHDVAWYHADGHALTSDDWNNPRSQLFTLDIGDLTGKGERWLVLFNASCYDIGFHLPRPTFGCMWEAKLDTAESDGTPFALSSQSIDLLGLTKAHSVKVIKQVIDPDPKVEQSYVHQGPGKIKLAINGFGRVGRSVLRQSLESKTVEVVGINSPMAGDANGNVTHEGVEYLAYLLKHDSSHGLINADVRVDGVKLFINERILRVTASKAYENLRWNDIGAEVVIDCRERSEVTMSDVAMNLTAGCEKVVVACNAVKDIPTFIAGINDNSYDGKNVIFAGSPAEACLAPMLKTISDKFGIESASVLSIASYDATQKTVDGPSSSSDWRLGRGCAQNIVPCECKSCSSVGLVLPLLLGKIKGTEVRVPTADVSVLDVTLNLRESGVTYADVCEELKKASETTMNGFMSYTSDAVVSSDFIGCTVPCNIDASAGTSVGGLVKIVAWYDNEMGYAASILKLAEMTVRSKS